MKKTQENYDLILLFINYYANVKLCGKNCFSPHFKQENVNTDSEEEDETIFIQKMQKFMEHITHQPRWYNFGK